MNCTPAHPLRAHSKWWALFFALFITPLLLLAQSGDISGTVRHNETGAFLQGAEVSVEGTAVRTTTARDGSFQLSGVPVGEQKVRIAYPGLDAQVLSVDVSTQPSRMSVALTSQVYQLSTYTVSGQREGNASAIAQQRAALSVKNVVSIDAYGSVADGNLGNMLQNVPGLTTVKEAGDIVGIGVRGAPPELNSVMVNGTRISAAIAGFTPQGDRAALIDQVPSEFIKSIEVTKGTTPDMMADSLGGAINLVTKSGFDFSNPVFTYRAGPMLNTFRKDDNMRLKKWGGQFASTYMDQFGANNEWALTASASYTLTTNTRDRIQQDHNFTTDNRNTRNRMLDDTNTRVRAGLGLKLEYRPSDTFRFFTEFSHNRFEMDTDRWDYQANTSNNNIADYSVVSRAAIEAGATPLTTAGATAGVAPTVTGTYTEMLNAFWYHRAGFETKRSKQTRAAIGGEKSWGDNKLSLTLSVNPSSYDNLYQYFFAQWRGIGFSNDSAGDPERPVYKQTYGTSIYTRDIFSRTPTSAFFAMEPDRTTEDLNALNLDFERKSEVFGLPMTFKAGGAFRHQDRWTINSYRPTWNYVGTDGVFGNDDLTGFLDGDTKSYGLFNGAYPSFYRFNFAAIRSYFDRNPTQFTASGTSVSFLPPPSTAEENVWAAYVMNTITLNKLTILGGVRMERTYVDGRSRLNDSLRPTTTTVHRTGDYRDYFPSLHFRYEPRRNLLFRASVSTGSARPSLSDIMPATTISYNSTTGFGTVSVNNPDLLPQHSVNYDATVEYYFEPAGVLSAGVFHKDITDFIYSDSFIIGSGTDNGWGGLYEGFTQSTTRNFGSAKIKGFEIDYRQRLTMLPKPFDGITLIANYTRQETEGQYRGGVTQLAGFIPETYNLGAVFAYGRFEGRYTFHMKKSWLVGFNSGTPFLSTYSTDDDSSDINLQYRLNKRLSLFLDYTNIFNQYPSQYNGYSTDRINISERYGARLNFGVTGRF